MNKEDVMIMAEENGYKFDRIHGNGYVVRFKRDDGLMIDIWFTSMTIGVYPKHANPRFIRNCSKDDLFEILMSPTTYKLRSAKELLR